jgi:hypothetical protein
VKFCGSIVRALWHGILLYRAKCLYSDERGLARAPAF